MSGIVGAVIAEKNQNLAPNSPTLSIINDASLKLTFGIPEGEIQGFAEGSKVVVFNAEGDSTVSKISSINRILDEKNRTFGAEIQLSNSGRKIKVGEIVRVKALPQAIKNVAIIPTGALMPVAQTTVVMIAQNGKAVRKVVQILASNETMTAISGDVKAGDALIVQGQNRVQDQTLVKIIPPSVEAKK
jgi:membrane fusion protein (multidrug efflux system)